MSPYWLSEGGTWLNTDSDSLEDFRGQYVLLDFWFIGCGPCEGEIPSLKKVYNLYREKGFTVISVHTAGQSPESVKQFCDARGMNFPLVVDSAAENILKAYRPLGVEVFPSYLLINPEGEIIPADMRSHKIETIRKHMHQGCAGAVTRWKSRDRQLSRVTTLRVNPVPAQNDRHVVDVIN